MGIWNTRRNRPPAKALTASGVVVNLKDPTQLTRLSATKTQWQEQAWMYMEQIGELAQAFRTKANALSKITFLPAQINADADEPILFSSDECTLGEGIQKAASRVLERLPLEDGFSFQGVISQNFDVTGECWLYGHTDDGTETWQALSISEVQLASGGGLAVTTLPGAPPVPIDPAKDALIRLWIPSPRFKEMATSPLYSMLDVCEDVVLAGREIRAAGRSRVMRNGLILMPDGMSIVGQGDDGEDDDETDVQSQLTRSLIAPISNPGHPGMVAPLVLRGDPADLKEFRHVQLHRDIDPQLLTHLDKALDRLADSIDLPREMVRGGLGDVNHWCKTAGHKVYSRDRGWITHDQLNVGDIVLTLNHVTGSAEWQPVEDIYRAPVTNLDMIRMKAHGFRSVSTPEHKWPIVKTGKHAPGTTRRWTTTGQGFRHADRLPVAAKLADTPVHPKYTDDFVRLVAAYTSDGTVLSERTRVRDFIRIAKFAEHEILEMRRILVSVFGELPAEYAHPTRTRDGVAWVLGADRSEHLFAVTGEHKAIRLSFVDDLTAAQCELLLSAMIEVGDGVPLRGGAMMFYQVEPARLDALERAATIAGYRVSRGVREHNTGFSDRPLHWIRVSRSRTHIAPATGTVTQETYTGTIWCPVTANHTWYCQDPSGTTYFTGNSGWLLDSQNFRNHLEPAVRAMADSLTGSYFRNALVKLEGLTAEEAAQVRVWYDAGAITENANRGADAKDAWDRGAIGREALAEALGFGKGDAPDQEDIRLWLASKGAPDQSSMAQLLSFLAGTKVMPQTRETITIPERGQIGPDGQPEMPSGEQAMPTAPSGLTSAANVQGVLDSGGFRVVTSERLADIDQALIDKLTVAADAAILRALEKALNRARSAAQHTEHAATFTTMPEHLDDALVQALGLREDKLLAGAFDALQARFGQWATAAIKQVAKLAAKLFGLNLAQQNNLVRVMSARVGRAWAPFADRLTQRALVALYGRHGDAQRGEVPDSIVQPGDIRQALSEIGGGSPDGVSVGGIGLGKDMTDVIRSLAGPEFGIMWEYGVEPRQTFPPHLALDDHRFDGPTDRRLIPSPKYAWIGPYFAPGDHPGCRCHTVRAWVFPENTKTMPDELRATVSELAADESQAMAETRMLAEQDDAAGRMGTHAQRQRDERDRILRIRREWLSGSAA